MSAIKTGAGWSDLGGQARKFHYFNDNETGARSLCGKWAIFRSHELGVSVLRGLVRERLDNGEAMPPGLGFYVRSYVSQRKS